ncbi:hypothetical protein [Clostridium sp. Cult2]|uniref:hypothetical protein n=1 Tax=Clostridium sp. Cult2 TaxID=2079003 RepID=UPI001F1F7FE4|nr:hypothetical protein [Clostridium sp. Cult2]MCF6465976.1 hypothetical protein [Clostridium sp. Cult2]
MFLHIGNNVNIFLKDIVAIIDKDSLENSKENNIYIQKLLKNSNLASNDMNDIKTYIVTCSSNTPRKNRKINKKHVLYVSNISSTTLFRRNKVVKQDWRLE